MAKKQKTRRQVIPKDESKADRFVRVVTPRVGKAIKAINLIGFCAGSTYEYTGKQTGQIVNALMVAVQSLTNQFEKKAEKSEGFLFKD